MSDGRNPVNPHSSATSFHGELSNPQNPQAETPVSSYVDTRGRDKSQLFVPPYRGGASGHGAGWGQQQHVYSPATIHQSAISHRNAMVLPPPPPPPENYLIRALLTTFFCFLPTGTIAIFFSVMSKLAANSGDYESARSYASTSRKLSMTSICIGTLCCIIFILFLFAKGFFAFEPWSSPDRLVFSGISKLKLLNRSG